MLFGEILLKSGMVTREQLDSALELQKSQDARQRLGEILVSQSVINEVAVLETLAQQMGLEVMLDVDPSLIDSSLVTELPVDWARANHMLPVRRNGEVIVLMSDPLKLAEQEELALLLGIDPLPVLAPIDVIARCIEDTYFQKTESAQDLIDQFENTENERLVSGNRKEDLLRSSTNAPVTQLVNLILLDAIKSGASDIHIEPFEEKLRVRFRIDGVLYEQAAPQKSLESAVCSRLKIMAKLDIAEKRLPQDGTARVGIGDREIDIRVSTLPVAEGERLVLRLLSRDTTRLSLTDLGMPREIHDAFRGLITEPNGVIWVTGPTGSGKTTTLYAALQEFDTGSRNILTIEDPIEYQLPNIGQMQAKEKIGLTFSRGLRHILRQDPDVILVGETRDLETAEIVTRASLTGHLVFSTLHTNDAVSAIVRLRDMGIEPYLVAAATRASTAQRLLRKLCPDCKKEAALTEEQQDALGPFVRRLEHGPVFEARGCPSCAGGYRGRVGCFEILSVDDDVAQIIRSEGSIADLREAFIAQGGRTLLDDALEKVATGVTSAEEVLRVLGRGHV